jgi:lipoprotein-anchoring transpeptidase ErfK/SrfK
MSINRRQLILNVVALAASGGVAFAKEPFPVFESDAEKIDFKLRRREVKFDTKEPAGTIVIDSQRYHLFFVLGNGKAVRYGIGVGRRGSRWTGEAKIYRVAHWPTWHPTEDQLQRNPKYEQWVKDGFPGGPDNPLGARALYLLNDGKDNAYRIHGTPLATTIGEDTTSGCFRMLNIDVIDLANRIKIGTRVVVLPRTKAKRNSLFGSVD